MFNISEYVANKTGSVLFVRKDGEIFCSESWHGAYRKIFKTKGTIEFIDVDNEYTTTNVTAKANPEDYSLTVRVPAAFGDDCNFLEIVYSVKDGIRGKVVVNELSEEIADLKENTVTTTTVTEEGDCVELDLKAGTDIKVVSSFSGSPDWDNTVRLHHVNGANLHDFVSRFGGVGATYSENGLNAVVNENGTITITGTNNGDGYTNIVYKSNDAPYSSLMYPPGTYTLPPRITVGCIDKVTGQGLGNKSGTFTMSTPFALHTAYIAFAAGATVNETIPLVFVRGTALPQSNLQYSGTVYKAILSKGYGEGIFDWSEGKLYDLDGNFLEEAASAPSFTAHEGKNTFFSDVGKNSNVKVSYTLAVTGGAVSGGAFTEKFNPEEWGLPVLYLDGNVTSMTKDDAVDLEYVYGLRKGTCSVKWQGSSSLSYAKKNYTIKFDAAFEAKDGWGEEKKYCAKANYIDHSHARNLVNAMLWGQIVKSRSAVPSMFANLVNAGAVDGFPILIVMNGEFLGLYTFNVPKDAWMMGMGSGTNECILCAGNACPANGFKEAATLEGENDLEIEYITNEDDTAWAKTSVNNLISACINSNGSDLDTIIAPMLDWQSAIDYYIFAVLIDGHDMTLKNYLLVTFNGTKWYFSGYDMDCTYGLTWEGKTWLPANADPTFVSFANQHRVMELIKLYKKDALKARYAELRETVLSESNIATTFANFVGKIPKPVYMQEAKKWPLIPNTSTNDISQIRDYYRMRVALADKWMEQL